MVKVSVTPVYYPEYRGLLVHLRVSIQLTPSLRLLKMHCDQRLASIQMSIGVSVAGRVLYFAEAVKLLGVSHVTLDSALTINFNCCK